MNLKQEIIDFILDADAKALATYSNTDINVVPVSMIRVVENKIWLANFFMNKTEQNLKANPKASLVCWKGVAGYQIKSSVAYSTHGEAFEEAKKWIAEKAPHRILKGLLILDPTAVFDVAPFKEKAGIQIE